MSTHETGPFFFAWVEVTETVFGPEHHVCDEFLWSITLDHAEDSIPTLEVEITNPGGLMAPGRKRWAWLSWRDPDGHVWPLFFGAIVAIPAGLLGEVVTVQFSAKPADYFAQQLKVAAALRVRPYYDPVFIDATERYKPETALLGYSRFWHVDRLTGEVTTSDVLIGEDGTEVFEEGNVPYDSVGISIDEAPLSIVRVNATVNWTQAASGVVGIIDQGTAFAGLYDPPSVVSAWPKAGDSLGSGWSVYQAKASGGSVAVQSTQNSLNQASAGSSIVSAGPSNDPWALVTEALNYENKGANHNFGDVMNSSMSYTHPRAITEGPVEFGPTVKKVTRVFSSISQDPDFVDRPTGSVNIEYEWDISHLDQTVMQGGGAKLGLIAKYDASRARTETIAFSLHADVQPVLADLASPGGPPSDAADYEDLTLQGSDVGVPLDSTQFWQDVADTLVTVGTYVDSNDGLSTFVCILDGLAGAIEPNWNRDVGDTTVDNTVTWACVPFMPPSVPDWKPTTSFPTGFTLRTVNGSSTTWQIATSGGVSGTAIPIFSGTPGETTTDSTVTWKSLGTLGPQLPPIGYPGRRSYFPIDRGLWSLENLICRARARLLYKARVAKITFDCTWERGIHLSCRKSATIYDHRLPGGVATGKITSYKLVCDPQAGKMSCSIELGCAVGYGRSMTGETGDPGYIEDGYIEEGYYARDGGTTPAASSDVFYSLPVDGNDDDGLTFPLSKYQAVKQLGVVDGALQLTLANITNGPFAAEYGIQVGNLTVPMGIDLAAGLHP